MTDALLAVAFGAVATSVLVATGFGLGTDTWRAAYRRRPLRRRLWILRAVKRCEVVADVRDRGLAGALADQRVVLYLRHKPRSGLVMIAVGTVVAVGNGVRGSWALAAVGVWILVCSGYLHATRCRRMNGLERCAAMNFASVTPERR